MSGAFKGSLGDFQERWEDFRALEPGERFQTWHERRRDSRAGVAHRVAALLLGVSILSVGLLLMPAPGPGIPIVLLGAALVAKESRYAARALDALEVLLRRVAKWSAERWRGFSLPAKAAAIALSVLLAVGLTVALLIGLR